MKRLSYKAMAAAFAVSRPSERQANYSDRLAAWQVTLFNVADVLGASQPKFNRLRFMQAAGYLVPGFTRQ